MAAKQLEEMLEAEMKLLNDRVRHDLPLTEAEWAAWRQWMGLVPSSSSSGRRKKKRRKRRLPRRVRIRRCGQGFRSRSSLSGAQCSLLLSTGLRCSASWPLWTRRTVLRFFRLRHVQGWFYWLFCTSRCCAFLVGSPPLGLHHGRYGSPGGVVPVVCNNRCLWSRSRFFCAVAAHQQGRLHHCDDAQIMQFIVEVILLVLVGCPALEHGY